MGLGLLETVGLAASLVFAIPLGIYAFERIIGGEPVLGGAFLLVALLMVLLPRYLTTPRDLPGKVAERVADEVVVEPEDGDEK